MPNEPNIINKPKIDHIIVSDTKNEPQANFIKNCTPN